MSPFFGRFIRWEFIRISSLIHLQSICYRYSIHRPFICCLSCSNFHNLDLSMYLQFSHPHTCSYFSSRSSPSPCLSKRCDFSWFRRHISRHVVAICSQGMRCSRECSLSILSTWLSRKPIQKRQYGDGESQIFTSFNVCMYIVWEDFGIKVRLPTMVAM